MSATAIQGVREQLEQQILGYQDRHEQLEQAQVKVEICAGEY